MDKEAIARIIAKHSDTHESMWPDHLKAADAIIALQSSEGEAFQARVAPWMQECFGPEISADRLERGDRFLEEVLELLQSGGYDPARVAPLVAYTWGRPAGEPAQEVGGVMVTLAAYCLAHGLDMHAAGETELARILRPEIVEKIRIKQAAKAAAIGNSSPLPVATLSPAEPSPLRREAWQPIESAPRDGTWFIALQDGETYPCQWHTSEPDEGPPTSGWWDHFNRSFEDPTHWQPAASRAAAQPSIRSQVIEECAKLIEFYDGPRCAASKLRGVLAAAIRSLNNNPGEVGK